MTSLASLGLLMAGVVALVADGVLIDRLAGRQLPYWSDRKQGGSPWSPRQVGHRRPFVVDRIGADREPIRRPAPVQRSDGQAPGPVVRPGEGKRLDIGGAQCVVKVNPARAAGSYALLEVVFPPGQPAYLPHVHGAFTETYWILDGRSHPRSAARSSAPGPARSSPSQRASRTL
jgi:hypothetical protein